MLRSQNSGTVVWRSSDQERQLQSGPATCRPSQFLQPRRGQKSATIGVRRRLRLGGDTVGLFRRRRYRRMPVPWSGLDQRLVDRRAELFHTGF